MVTTLAGVALAAVAAVGFSWAVRLQHGAVVAVGVGGRLSVSGVPALVRSPGWRTGAALTVLATSLHIGALSLAPLAVVQPVGVLSLVVTVLLAGHASTGPLSAEVRWAVVAVCAGVAGFVVVSALTMTAAGPVSGDGVQVVVVVVLLAAAGALRTSGRARCVTVASCAAAVFGLGSSLIRAATQDLIVRGDVVAALWVAGEAAALAVCGAWLVHQAYAAGPAAVTVAATTVLDPVTAVIVGIAFGGEVLMPVPVLGIGQVALALAAVAGVLVLARSVPDERDARPERRPSPPAGDPMRILIGARRRRDPRPRRFPR